MLSIQFSTVFIISHLQIQEELEKPGLFTVNLLCTTQHFSFRVYLDLETASRVVSPGELRILEQASCPIAVLLNVAKLTVPSACSQKCVSLTEMMLKRKMDL